jgi:hypothetical protein
MKMADGTALEFTEGIARLFVASGLPERTGRRGAAQTVILVMDDAADTVSPDLLALVARHRGSGKVPMRSMFRYGLAGRMVVIVMNTEPIPDLREPLFKVSTIRLMRSSAGAGLLTFVCLEEEWADATGETELPIQGRSWPREN